MFNNSLTDCRRNVDTSASPVFYQKRNSSKPGFAYLGCFGLPHGLHPPKDRGTKKTASSEWRSSCLALIVRRISRSMRDAWRSARWSPPVSARKPSRSRCRRCAVSPVCESQRKVGGRRPPSNKQANWTIPPVLVKEKWVGDHGRNRGTMP